MQRAADVGISWFIYGVAVHPRSGVSVAEAGRMDFRGVWEAHLVLDVVDREAARQRAMRGED